MGLFNFFKKNDEGVPDVGKEISEEDNTNSSDGGDLEVSDDDSEELESDEEYIKKAGKKKGKGAKGKALKISSNSLAKETINLDVEKIKGRLESLNEIVKGFNERISVVNQQIGELRSMNINNEKSVSKLSADSARAIDIVGEVKPEKLRFDFQKVEIKVDELSQKLESNQQFLDTIMNEVKDLRRKSGLFIGTDALLRLNEDVKKDLIAAQQVASKTRMHADKTEQMFIDMNKVSMENRKLLESVSNLDVNYSGVKKEIEKIKLDFSKLADKSDIDEIKNIYDRKIVVIESAIPDIAKVQSENERLARIMETALGISQENKKNIEKLALKIGDDSIAGVGEYEDQINSILRILDSLAGQISEVKKKAGLSGSKVEVPHEKKKPLLKGKLSLKNINVHPEVSKPLVSIGKNALKEKINPEKVDDEKIESEKIKSGKIKLGNIEPGKIKLGNIESENILKKNKKF